MANDELQKLVERFWQGKARGLLLGQACVDGLVSSWESSAARAPVEFDDHAADEHPFRHTAVTELALGVAEYLTNHRTVRHVDAPLLQTYLAHTWWAGQQRRGFGADDTRLFQAVLAARARPQAAVPRVGVHPAAPVAPFALTTLSGPGLPETARMCAGLLTHDVTAHAAAAMFASAAALALAGDPTRTVSRLLMHRLHAAAGPDGAPATRTLEQLAADGASASTAGQALLTDDLGATGPVAAAVLAFLSHPDHPHHAVRYAVHVGGPSSTIASMTGALVGARHGVRGLPHTWRARLEGADKIEELAGRLSHQHTAVLAAP